MSFPGRAAQRCWHLIDASGQVTGRLAQQIAPLLKGKYKPTYRPNGDCGDYVVVINASKVHFSGKKLDDKIYYRHTGFPGGLMQRTAGEQLKRQPEKVIWSAVMGMLNKNTLRHRHIEPKLLIYAGSEHPHAKELAGKAALKQVPRRLDGTHGLTDTNRV